MEKVHFSRSTFEQDVIVAKITHLGRVLEMSNIHGELEVASSFTINWMVSYMESIEK